MRRCNHSPAKRISTGTLKGRCSVCLKAARDRYEAKRVHLPLGDPFIACLRSLDRLTVDDRRSVVKALALAVGA